jgi:hypothetical protein
VCRQVFRLRASSSKLLSGDLYSAPSLVATAWLPYNGPFQVLVAEDMEGRSMFALILGLTSRTYFALRRFMPTNLVLDAIHTRRGLKWGVPAMLLAVPYAFAMAVCVGLVEAGGPGWLNVLALLFAWNALKFLGAGPVTLMRLLRTRGREGQARHLTPTASLPARVEQERFDEPQFMSGHG